MLSPNIDGELIESGMELNKDKAAVAQELNFKGYAVVFYDDCTTVLVYSSAINA